MHIKLLRRGALEISLTVTTGTFCIQLLSRMLVWHRIWPREVHFVRLREEASSIENEKKR